MRHISCPHCASLLEDQDLRRMGVIPCEFHDALEESHTEAVLTKKRLQAQIAAMKKDREAQPQLDPFWPDALEIFRYWKQVSGTRAYELEGERFKHVRARLEKTWTVADIKRAIDGAQRNLLPGRTYTELTTICRNEENLMMFIEMAGRDVPDSALEPLWKRLDLPDYVVERLCELRGWQPEVVRKLELRFDGERIVFPLRNGTGALVGMSHWQPNSERRNGKPKNIAQGKRELFPPPETIDSDHVWLVEGEPDAVAMWSVGYPAVGTPGVQTWVDGWEQRFSRFERVRICFDCDEPGRAAADKRQAALSNVVSQVQTVDLNEGDDGYDICDLLLEYGDQTAVELTRRATGASSTVLRLDDRREDSLEPPDLRAPVERVREALEARGHTVRGGGSQLTSTCPNHDDRHPSLAIGVGDDERVLVHCHAGCEPEEVVHSLGLEMKQLFDRKVV